MHVELLYHTPDPERAIATAARLCYAPVGAAELMETMSEERMHSVLSTIMASGHFSTLEHVSYTFAIDGVSRALTHQLVRHRLASFNQQSQRYVKFKEGVSVVKPESVLANEEANAVFDEAIEAATSAYKKLLDAGVPAEDARYLLPNAAESKIVVTMNVRELLHFFSLRCCNRAQWEIRELAHRMLELARPTAPFVFADAGAPCVRGACPEGKMTCGNCTPKQYANSTLLRCEIGKGGYSFALFLFEVGRKIVRYDVRRVILSNPGEPERGRRSLVPLVKKKAPSVSNETECMPKENEVDQKFSARPRKTKEVSSHKRSAVKRAFAEDGANKTHVAGSAYRGRYDARPIQCRA